MNSEGPALVNAGGVGGWDRERLLPHPHWSYLAACQGREVEGVGGRGVCSGGWRVTRLAKQTELRCEVKRQTREQEDG